MDYINEDFDSVFDNNEDTEVTFDTIFAGQDDGEMIDNVCGFDESGECVTDFDEIHQEPGDAGYDDFERDLRVDSETINAPDNAEGTDTDPAIDLALGEDADPEFSDRGKKGSTEADDWYSDYNEEEDEDALTGEGRDVNMDNEDIEGEFDRIAESSRFDIDSEAAYSFDFSVVDEAVEDSDNDVEECGADNFDEAMEGLDDEEAGEDEFEELMGEDYEDDGLTEAYDDSDSDLIDYANDNDDDEF